MVDNLEKNKDEKELPNIHENNESSNDYDEESIEPVNKKNIILKMMARVAIFGALATILYVVPGLQLKLPIFGFLEFHFDDIPSLIAGFGYGPLTSFFVILIKTLVKLPFSKTLCIGELSDLIYSCAFIIPAAIIYKKHRSFKGCIVGVSVGFVAEIIIAILFNGLFMIDFYLKLFHIDMNAICSMFSKLKVTDMKSLLINAILPFNVIKNILIVGITLLVYKPLRHLLEKAKL